MPYMHSGYGVGMMGYGTGLGGWDAGIGALLVVVLAWHILWKGLALWRAAKRGDFWWFIAFLFINTLGILEIIYLFVVTGAKLSDFTSRLTHDPHHHTN